MFNLNVFYQFLAIKLELVNIHNMQISSFAYLNFILTDNAVALI